MRVAIVCLLSTLALTAGWCRAAAAAEPAIEMVLVKGGCFAMGDLYGEGAQDERPVHQVCVDDYYIGKYTVTQGQWRAVMGQSNDPKMPRCEKSDTHPVEGVNWDGTQSFIARLNALTGKKYRLPTEAEWEYAARSGGSAERWPGTSDEEQLKEHAWYADNAEHELHEVGRRKPNGLGIHDMGGNTQEWVSDWYDEGYYEESPRSNPRGPTDGKYRVLRGGSFKTTAKNARSAARSADAPSLSGFCISGFRLAISAE